MNIQNIITNKIINSSDEKITFHEYMDLVLYHHEYGYYNNEKIKIGKQGDFFTSSSLGSDFGELLAEQFLEMWQILGKPTNFMLVEMGAGDGILANDILTYLHNKYPNFLKSLEYIIIEKSTYLRTKQRNNLDKWHSKLTKISWQKWEDIKDNSLIGCLFSNELLDAFPVHKIIKINENLKEIYVTIKENTLQESIGILSTNEIENYFKLIEINLLDSAYPNQYQTEVNLDSLHWLKTVSNKLKKGYLLTIDYGYPSHKYYHPQRNNGTLKCYYQHRHHDNPYLNLGSQDITTHVDFTALEIQGKLYELEKIIFTQQALFLMALGLGNKLASLSQEKISIIEMLQKRDYLHQLMNPSGIGGFGVLIQGKGLTEKEKKILPQLSF